MNVHTRGLWTGVIVALLVLIIAGGLGYLFVRVACSGVQISRETVMKPPSLDDLTGGEEKLVPTPKPEEKVTEEVAPPAEDLVIIVDGNLVCEGPGIVESMTKDQIPAVIQVDQGQVLTFAEGGNWCGLDVFPSQAALEARFKDHAAEFLTKAGNENGIALVLRGGKLIPLEKISSVELEEAVIVPEPSEKVPAPGEVAWHQDTNARTWQATPVGQLDPELPILAETWGEVDGKNKGFIVVIPPGAVMWIQHHYGGTGWWIALNVDLQELAEKHADDIEALDGTRPTIVFLPDDWFPLLGCLQTKAIENDIRICDAVGDRARFTQKVGEPFPGYFPDP